MISKRDEKRRKKDGGREEGRDQYQYQHHAVKVDAMRCDVKE